MSSTSSYLGGFRGVRAKKTITWWLRFEPEGLFVYNNDTGLMSLAMSKCVHAEPWATVRVALEPSGTRQLNPVAIAAFGIPGLAAGGNGTYLTVRFSGGDVYFLSKHDVHSWRAAMNPLMEEGSPAAGSITFGPIDPAESPVAYQDQDVLEQLARLGKLRDDGVVSDEEFAAKKSELLRRL